ncbi:hypothetical protein DFH09DRAFT_1284978 [Mycena vulgaris]|nr:hypothetical protein DFH09DRAFT_1284978 [Mycena vulgaris]
MTPFAQIILGLVGPGFALTIAVLGLYAYLAWNPLSRKHLDRVSFRLLVYALVAQLVLVHKLNGQRMEKYYILGTAIICGACNGSAYASGNLGWDAVNGTCWYRSSDSGAMLRWLIGTQTFWILLVSLGEVVAFLTIVGYLIGYERPDGTGTQFSETSQTPGSTIQMFRRHNPPNRQALVRLREQGWIINRAVPGLYPLVSCLLNISTSILDLHEMRHGEQTQLESEGGPCRCSRSSAPCGSSATPARRTRTTRAVGAGAAPGCLSTVIEMTAAERNANDRMSTYGREEGLESLGDAARTAVNSPTHSQGEEKILSDKDGMESATASASEKRHSQMADVVFHSI